MNLDMEFGGLSLTAKAWDVLKGDELVSGVIREDTLNESREKMTDSKHGRVLFEELRKNRKTFADKANVPPYVIFSDKTLMEMAISFPQTEDALLDIHGVGAVKCEKYGSYFLRIIQEYCRRNAIEERPRKIKREPSPVSSLKAAKRYVVIGEAYNSGQSLEKIMTDFNIKQITIINHLLKYLLEGNVIRSDGLLALSKIPPDKIPLVIKAFKRLGTEFLKPVFDAFDGEFEYDELHVVRLYCLSKDTNLRRTADSVRHTV